MSSLFFHDHYVALCLPLPVVLESADFPPDPTSSSADHHWGAVKTIMGILYRSFPNTVPGVSLRKMTAKGNLLI